MVLLRFNERAWVALTLVVSNSLLVKADLLTSLRGVKGLDDNNARYLTQPVDFTIKKCGTGCLKDVHCMVCSVQ